MKKHRNLKNTIKKIAKNDNVTTDKVVSEMQKAIDEAWSNSDSAAQAKWNKLFPNGKPTADEFICVITSKTLSNTNF